METDLRGKIAAAFVCMVMLSVLFWLGLQKADAATCGYPNGPKTGTMTADINEWKTCGTMPGLTPPGEFWMTLSNMPAGSQLGNGLYGSYCADLTGTILDNPQQGNIVYTVDFWSSIDPNLPIAVKQVTDHQNITYTIPWAKINYLLNKYPGASWLNLQAAYWDLVHGCTQAPGSLYTCGALRPAPYYFPYGPAAPYGCPTANPPLVDEVKVQNMVNDANANGSTFIPKAGDKIASVGKITNCSPSTICNQYLPYQVFFIPTTCPTCTGKIGDFIWKDLNGDGSQDSNEPGIPGVEVKLSGTDYHGQSISLTTTTDNAGKYEFSQLCTGNYKITVDSSQPSLTNLDPTINRSANGDDNKPLDSNEPLGTLVAITTDASSNLTVDFGYVPRCSGSIGNLVWKDIPNENGLFDSGEPVLSGVTLSLTGTSAYGVSVSMIAVTNGSGLYSFDGLCQGDYTVQVVSGIPAGFVPATSTSSSGDDLIDNDSNNPAGTAVKLLADNISNQTVDFGYVPDCQGTIGNFVWEDLNKNGAQDTDEPGIEDVVVKLGGTNVYGELVSMTETTKNGGMYLFNGICEGEYTVTVNPSTVPSGWIATTPRSADGSDGKETDSNEPNGTIVTMNDDTTNNPSVDFGYIPDCKGTIGDFVWMDINGNGLQDDGAGSGIDGVQVLLTGTNIYGQSVNNLPSTTAGGGYYQFTGLCQGNYTVAVNTATLPAEVLPVSPLGSSNGNDGVGNDSNQPIGTTVLLANNSSFIDTVDFGYIKLASIGDRVWEDKNNNGLQDDGATGLNGWTVTLTKPDNSTVTFTTAGDGIYGFSNLAPGTYKVCATPMSGYTQTYDLTPPLDNCANVTLNSGDNRTDVDFGYVMIPATIGDFVWDDLNNNGKQDLNEPGIANVKVDLFDCSGKFIATTTTGVTGNYSFSVAPGSYYAVFTAPFGYTFTSKGLVPAAGDDSNADSNGKTDCITVASGETNNTIDAGLFRPAKIGNFVWEDKNYNGVQDDGETGIANVTVELYNCGGAKVATTFTDASGYYLFVNLMPGSYSVKFIAPAGYTITLTDQGSDDTKDSDADATTGMTSCILLAPGQYNDTIDAGLYKPCIPCKDGVTNMTLKLDWRISTGDRNERIRVRADSLTGQVLYDSWNDGNTDPGLPVGAIFSFDVPPSAKQVVVTVQGLNHYTETLKATFSAECGLVLGTINGNTYIKFSVVSAEFDGDLVCTPNYAKIGNLVWEDKNYNGVQDAGETGVANATVELYNCGGAKVATTITDASGYYLFANLIPGSYSVKFIAPAGYTITLTDQGSDDTKDSDADATTGMTSCILLAPGQYNDTIDAGLYKPCIPCKDGVTNMTLKLDWRISTGDRNERIRVRADSLTGQVLYDSWNDGNTDPGLPVGAIFSFDVPPSAKQVVVTVQGLNHYTETLKATFSAECGLVLGTINGNSYITFKVMDFKLDGDLVCTPSYVSIGNFVWNDLNNNGIQDSGEPGIPGVTVTLKNSTTGAIVSTVTDSSGNYLFPGLLAGTYIVTAQTPDQFNASPSNQGADRAKDSNGSPATVILGSSNDLTIDFGYYKCPIPAKETGCSLGYWKNHTNNWPSAYHPTDNFDTVFNVDAFKPNITLLGALNLGGGGLSKLARQGVAALLNAQDSRVTGFPMSVLEVKTAIKNAIITKKYEPLATQLDLYNNLGCPLD